MCSFRKHVARLQNSPRPEVLPVEHGGFEGFVDFEPLLVRLSMTLCAFVRSKEERRVKGRFVARVVRRGIRSPLEERDLLRTLAELLKPGFLFLSPRPAKREALEKEPPFNALRCPA